MPVAPEPANAPAHNLRQRWQGLSLLSQFGLMGALVLVLGMSLMGVWVTEQIKAGVMRNTAAATALFMSSFIEPAVQELAYKKSIDEQTHQLLDELLNGTELSRRILSFKIWKEDGLVVYSSKHELIGQQFPETHNLQEAWQGHLAAEFDSLSDEENVLERDEGVALLEMYSPIRQNRTGRIIAVAEFYERADDLRESLFWSNVTSWLVVGSVTVLMLGALSGIVLRGSRTIDQQRLSLQQQVTHLSSLLEQNEELRSRLQRASRRTTEINERYLRRISADLHDGPAQLMAFALLRIDSLRRTLEQYNCHEDLATLRNPLSDAMSEIRAICTGLTLPELEKLSPEKLLRNVASAHERRTGSRVTVEILSAPHELSQPYKICVYRFVQETLNNAYHHAGGRGQKVIMQGTDSALEIEVADRGEGFAPQARPNEGHGLGLPGLRDRIESLGGQMRIISSSKGTRIIMNCDISPHIEEELP